MLILSSTHTNKAFFRLIWLSAVSILLLAGIGYRSAAIRLELIAEKAIELPVNLAAFPLRINNWTGEDVPISEGVQRLAQNDDFLNRFYVNESTGQWVNIYVAYSARPRTMRGHEPKVCYIAAGWIHDSTERSEFTSVTGRVTPCLVHRFHQPVPQTAEIVVLNFYILNGQIAYSEKGFSGVGWRTPNIAGDPARYVAQVQISSALENSVRAAATDITYLMLDFFPDGAGRVKVAENAKTPRDVD